MNSIKDGHFVSISGVYKQHPSPSGNGVPDRCPVYALLYIAQEGRGLGG